MPGDLLPRAGGPLVDHPGALAPRMRRQPVRRLKTRMVELHFQLLCALMCPARPDQPPGPDAPPRLLGGPALQHGDERGGPGPGQAGQSRGEGVGLASRPRPGIRRFARTACGRLPHGGRGTPDPGVSWPALTRDPARSRELLRRWSCGHLVGSEHVRSQGERAMNIVETDGALTASQISQRASHPTHTVQPTRRQTTLAQPCF